MPHEQRVAIQLLLLATSVIPEFLQFKAKHIGGITSVVLVATPVSHRFIPARQASIIVPGRSILFEADSSATHAFVDGFHLLIRHHYLMIVT